MMDDLLPILLSFPPHPAPPQPLSDQQYDESIKSQIDSLRRLSARKLLQSTSSGEHLLNVIDPSLNTIPYIHVLLANVGALQNQSHGTLSHDELWQKMLIFLDCFDQRQIRYTGTELSEVISVVISFSRQLQQPGLAVAPIRNALLRLDPVGSTLTSTHLLLAQLCLESQAYAAAAPVLDRPVLYIPDTQFDPKLKFVCSARLSGFQYITQESGLTQKLKYQDILEYFVLGGTIYTGMRQWEKALEMFENAITYPVKENAVSKIMVEGYKKWTLVNLLHKGKVGSLPSTTNSNAAKIYHILGKPYDTVANLFESAPAARLKAEIEIGQEIWEKDGNSGLMHCVLAAYQESQIRNLAQVYHTIPVTKVTQVTVSAETGKRLGNDQATEALIQSMLSRQELHASVSQTQDSISVLTFNSVGPSFSELNLQRQLLTSMEQAKLMMEDIKSTDRRLTHDKEYLRWVVKQRKYGNNTSGDGYSAEELGWNLATDEDLMSS